MCSDKTSIQIVSENDEEIIAFCPFHQDNKRPNLLINKRGEFAGRYVCWACGAGGEAEELNIQRDWKKEKKDYPKINWEDVQKGLVGRVTSENINYLAEEWHINPSVLIRLQHGWNDAAHTFPMRNSHNKIIGIQRRYETGEIKGLKLAMKRSKLGLFVPQGTQWNRCSKIFITEGLSDLAILLDLGFVGIGRPNALACIDMTASWLKHNTIPGSKYIVIADADEAGIVGARTLTRDWNEFFNDMRWYLPLRGNDLRKWVQIEGKEKVKRYLESL